MNESSRTCLEAFVTGLELIKKAKQIIADKDATQEKKQILYFLCSDPTIDNGNISFNPSKLAQVFLKTKKFTDQQTRPLEPIQDLDTANINSLNSGENPEMGV